MAPKSFQLDKYLTLLSNIKSFYDALLCLNNVSFYCMQSFEWNIQETGKNSELYKKLIRCFGNIVIQNWFKSHQWKTRKKRNCNLCCNTLSTDHKYADTSDIISRQIYAYIISDLQKNYSMKKNNYNFQTINFFDTCILMSSERNNMNDIILTSAAFVDPWILWSWEKGL